MGLFGNSNNKQETTISFHNTEELEKEISEFKVSENPASTVLTPHELFLLRQLGFEPVQVVFGNVVYSMGLRGLLRTVWSAFSRGEMVDFSRLNKDARLLARNRMVTEAKVLGASQVIGVKIETREYADFMEVVATGTAVKPLSQTSMSSIPTETPIAVGV